MTTLAKGLLNTGMDCQVTL